MRWIAHRGNLNGSSPDQENTESYIQAALDQGFDVECDLYWDTGRFLLGHDLGGTATTVDFLSQPGIWCHAKTVTTFHEAIVRGLHGFFQARDDVALTSQGFLWTHARCPIVTPKSILVIVEFDAARHADVAPAAGICSDHVADWRAVHEEHRTPLTEVRVDG